MSPLFSAAVILLFVGPVDCFCSEKMGRASTIAWWVGLILWVLGLVLFAAAVIMYLVGPVQGIVGAHTQGTH